MTTVTIGLSGGVDSTLAAKLLQEQGYTVIGLTMSIYNKDIPNMRVAGNACYGPEEKQDIQVVRDWCAEQGIESYILDCSEEYKHVVLKYFKESYLAGITPNPCVKCNSDMKFGLLLDKARAHGIAFDLFATGHYVRTAAGENGRMILQTGLDDKKDQSYFLYRLSQEQLKQTLFPLGNYTKEQVRQMAADRGLAAAAKKDSQDFYAGDYADLLQQEPRPGNIVHTSGRILGHHLGFWQYTIGQRRGLGIAYPVPLYVVDIDAAKNEVIVGEVEATYTPDCIARDIVMGGVFETIEPNTPVLAKYRSAGRAVPARITSDGNTIHTIFDKPERAVTRGQSIVFYTLDGLSVIAGGIIG